MTCLIEYKPGCKGDFLFNELMQLPLNINEWYRSTASIIQRLKIYISQCEYLHNNHVDEDKLVEILNDTKKYKFAVTHDLDLLEKLNLFHLLKENGYVVKKIKYNKKYYRTVIIEAFFKNIKNDIYGFEYVVDKELVENNLELNDNNRIEAVKNYLDNEIDNLIQWHDKFNQNLTSRETWDYEDLYINFKFNDPLLHNLNKEDYKFNLSKTWLPKKLDLFGVTWDLEKYGYLQF